ncbi:sterol desaturase family protein [Nocardia abscessus]|uniref:sterol desaturase family protein n=1 Tax=Nocardia TaxID=1817 RepID=UPI0018934B81|nr:MULTISPECIES: sterol desaturase family protein [Nocardia]MBF6220898.1 sterol desaturase family protein [Nocardia abscessus]MDE1671491.1 sterol desaturase family protein [Nocardia gipuzkoensis]
MTKSKASERDSIDADARARVRRDERALRRGLTLGQAFEEFRRHPSPWMIGTTLVGAVIARIVVGDWQPTDLLVPAVMLAMFPVFEWIVHVTVLHWRPRRLGPIALDSELARKHREHHVDPRDIPLIFIPTKTLSVLVVVLVALALFAFPRLGLGLTFLITITLLGLGYEWTHYLVHTDYKPKGSLYRAVWRNHRHHHYKNEHYWFTVTSSGTADRLFGTYPDPATTETSPTARNLHSA